MNMVASMSIIRGKGGVRSVMDNVIKNETERQEIAHATELAELKENHDKEMKELQERHARELSALKEKCKRQSNSIAKLKRQRDSLFKYIEPESKKGILHEVKERLTCIFIGLCFLGERLGLLEIREREVKGK